jgi:Tfp pilus assembly protein PilF
MRNLALLTSLVAVLVLAGETPTPPERGTPARVGGVGVPPALPASAAAQAAWLIAGERIATGDWAGAAAVLAPVADQLDPNGVLVLALAQTSSGHPAAGDATLSRGVTRWPHSEALRLARLDQQLARGQYAAALEGFHDAVAQCGATPELHWRAARAYFAAGAYLGAVEVREVPDGRPDRFIDGWLLIEPRPGRDRFLCSPESSALYHVRQALAGGLQRAEVHLLHARLWQRAGRPELGLALLRGRQAELLAQPDPDVPATLAELALAIGDLGVFLNYAQQHADHDPDHREQILLTAYLDGADLCAQRGDDALYRNLLTRALTLRPDDVGVLLRAADADWDADQHAVAVTRYRRVLDLQPDHAARRRILERLAEAETPKDRGGK